MKLKTKSKKKLALAACLVACVAVCAMVIACKYVNVYPEVTVRFNLNGGSYGGVPAEKLDLAVTGVCFEKLPSSSIFGNFDEFKFDRFDENGDMLMPVWSSDVEGITFEEYILKRKVFPRQDVRFTCTWVPTTITFSAPTVVADGIEFSVTDVSGGSNIPDGTKLSIQTVDTSTQQTVTGFFDESKLNSSNNKIKLVPQKEVDPNVMLNLIATDKNGKLLGKKINMPIKNLYRYFEGPSGEKYAFGIKTQWHFEGKNLTAPLERGSTASDVTLEYGKDHILEFTLTASGSRNSANCLVMYNKQKDNIPDFDYVEYRFKDTGNAGIAYATNNRAWVYKDGKFKTQTASFSSFNVPDITENNQISTEYKSSNNEYAVFGIWNGTSGADTSKSLLMEYLNIGEAYKTVLHEVQNSGTEKLKDTTDYLRFLVRPSSSSTVEVDYIAFFKKIN